MTSEDRAPLHDSRPDRPEPAVSGDRLPPGPADELVRFRVKPAELWEECARRYGDTFTLRFAGAPPFVFFSHPDAIKQIFAGDEEDVRAGEVTRWFEFLFGPGSLVLLDGARHMRERRLMTPPFHGARVHAHAGIIREVTDRAIARWPLGRPFPIHPEMQGISLDVIMRAVFGVEDTNRVAELRRHLTHFLAVSDGAFGAAMVVPAGQRQPDSNTPWGRFLRARAAVATMLEAEIARRRAAGAVGRTDVLSLLVEARDEAGRMMSDDELRDEMFTLLLGGHDTTATSLAWVFYRVLPRPDVLEGVRAELRAVVGEADVQPEHVSRLAYLDAVIKEAARLDPAIHMIGRQLRKPMRIGAWDLPAGVSVFACIYLTHRRSDVWRDPLRFAPERFLDVRPSPYTFFPFGGGVRRCLGAAFATYEMKVILARVFSRAELRLAAGYVARRVQRTLTVRPSGGVPVVLERRLG